MGSTVDQQPEGKVVRQSREEVQHETFSQPTQPIPKPIRDRSGQPEDTQGVWWKVKRPVFMRSVTKVFTKNSASDGSGQPEITLSVIEARNLSEKPVLSTLTIDQGNLMSVTAQEHTQ